MTHHHTKPFNLDHAKQSAPIGLARQDGGYTVEVLKYGEEKIFGVLTDPHGNETAEYWNHDGTYGIAAQHGVLSLVMLPLGYCEGKPVFVGDMLEWAHMGRRESVLATPEMRDMDDLTWPSPEPKYPETRIDKEKWYEIWATYKGDAYESCIHVANESIKKAIQDGDIFTKQQVTAVLEELRNICDRQINPYNIRQVVDGTDWDAVLKGSM